MALVLPSPKFQFQLVIVPDDMMELSVKFVVVPRQPLTVENPAVGVL